MCSNSVIARLAGVLGLSALLSPVLARETAPPAADSHTPSETWVFIAPADTDPKLGGLACGIRFGTRQTSAHGGRYGEIERTSSTTARLTTFVGSQNFSVGKGFEHDLSVAEKRTEDRCAVAFSFLEVRPIVKGGNFLNFHQAPAFTAADVLVQTSTFLYRPTFTSNYSAEALMSNFDRLATKGCENVGVVYQRQLPEELRSNNQLYCIPVDGQHVPVNVECHPYREGAQCSVLSKLAVERNGRTFDARQSATKLHDAVMRIIND